MAHRFVDASKAHAHYPFGGMSNGAGSINQSGFSSVDIAIVGGGIAGMSAAYYLSKALPDATVGVFEAEATLTHHTTGRSAAIFRAHYGTDAMLALTPASREPFDGELSEIADGPLLSSKGYLTVADEAKADLLGAQGAALASVDPDLHVIETTEAIELAPCLRPEAVALAYYEPLAQSIDVAGTHQAFLRGFRRNGGVIGTTQRVDAAVRNGTGWTIDTTAGLVGAGLLVNAAGAWGDQVAERAGVAPVGLEPKRRTAFMVDSPFDGSELWPMIAELERDWYTKSDGPQMLCSPADETPSEPCDAKPEEIDIALAIDRLNTATTLNIRSVKSAWAGLRTFAPDRTMVIGPDPEQPTFIWCVGQGGTGIQTSPAVGELVADLVSTGNAGERLNGFDVAALALLPDRLRR